MLDNHSLDNASFMDTEKMMFLPHQVRLVIGHTSECVEVFVTRPIIIGRSDDGSAVDVDLTHKGGYRMGISRQHMQLAPAGENIIATDLNSRNGSKINGQSMRPMQAYAIHSGDTLQLSGLDLHIRSIS